MEPHMPASAPNAVSLAGAGLAPLCAAFTQTVCLVDSYRLKLTFSPFLGLAGLQGFSHLLGKRIAWIPFVLFWISCLKGLQRNFKHAEFK